MGRTEGLLARRGRYLLRFGADLDRPHRCTRCRRTNFLDPANLANILYQASFVAIIAVPMTLVLISGNFDLSVASTAAISAACVLLLSDESESFRRWHRAPRRRDYRPRQRRGRAGPGHQRLHRDTGDHDRAAWRALDHHRRSHRFRDDREAVSPLKWIENGFWLSPNLLWCAGAVALFAGVIRGSDKDARPPWAVRRQRSSFS